MLVGEFWELKAKHLKVARSKEHGTIYIQCMTGYLLNNETLFLYGIVFSLNKHYMSNGNKIKSTIIGLTQLRRVWRPQP